MRRVRAVARTGAAVGPGHGPGVPRGRAAPGVGRAGRAVGVRLGVHQAAGDGLADAAGDALRGDTRVVPHQQAPGDRVHPCLDDVLVLVEEALDQAGEDRSAAGDHDVPALPTGDDRPGAEQVPDVRMTCRGCAGGRDFDQGHGQRSPVSGSGGFDAQSCQSERPVTNVRDIRRAEDQSLRKANMIERYADNSCAVTGIHLQGGSFPGPSTGLAKFG